MKFEFNRPSGFREGCENVDGRTGDGVIGILIAHLKPSAQVS